MAVVVRTPSVRRMTGGELGPEAAGEARKLIGAGEQRYPQQDVEGGGRDEETERDRGRQQPALRAGQEGCGERHRPQRTRRSFTSSAQSEPSHDDIISCADPRSSSSG